MRRARVLFVQPNMQPPGGGQCVSAWAAQALQDEYALDMFTWMPLGVGDINRFYGTTLDSGKIKNYHPPDWLRAIVDLDSDPWSYQRLALMTFVVKHVRRKYDAVVSFCDEVDLGEPALQYIHFPYMWKIYRRRQALLERSRLRALAMQLRPWRILSGFSFDRMRQNISLVNSEWTGAFFSDIYHAPFRTVYPPVAANFPRVPWAEREQGFVCIGRFTFEKRYEDIVSILNAVRAHGHDIHLHIIGAAMYKHTTPGYYRLIQNLVRDHSSWVSLHENISRTELEWLVARHRYGIHAARDEHFGIAPAEMVRGGCIVFVPNSGGQVEIVGNQERLRYDLEADAVEKIERVLSDEHAQTELRASLAARAELFTPERFMRQVSEIVSNQIKQTGQCPHGS